MAPEEAADEVAPLHDLTGFQRDLVAAIGRLGEPKGLAVKDLLDGSYEPLNHGRLYPNLDALVEMGLVEKGKIDNRTNKYVLTGRGRQELESHIKWLSSCV